MGISIELKRRMENAKDEEEREKFKREYELEKSREEQEETARTIVMLLAASS